MVMTKTCLLCHYLINYGSGGVLFLTHNCYNNNSSCVCGMNFFLEQYKYIFLLFSYLQKNKAEVMATKLLYRDIARKMKTHEIV